jgi:hypothetical protein
MPSVRVVGARQGHALGADLDVPERLGPDRVEVAGIRRSSPAAGWRAWAWARPGPAPSPTTSIRSKAATYRDNFADAAWPASKGALPRRRRLEDRVFPSADLPTADLAWASSPCQDFSLAGARAGLQAESSSAFFGFWKLMEALSPQGAAPTRWWSRTWSAC